MKVYTKTGDKGETSRYDGIRLPKDHPDILIMGKLDSLMASIDSAALSVLEAANSSIVAETQFLLDSIHTKLWQTAGEISLGKPGKNVKDEITQEDITALEQSIDKYNPNNSFFIRFKTESSIRLNEARVRCRALESALTPKLRSGEIREEVYQYINRLSDLFYVLACFIEKT